MAFTGRFAYIYIYIYSVFCCCAAYANFHSVMTIKVMIKKKIIHIIYVKVQIFLFSEALSM